jgi:hypothetical protein
MSLRRAGTLAFALALTACHTVTMEPQPADLVFATFNSTTGVIPVPNDLVIQKAATATPSASLPAAQIEVLQGYAKSGGFPSDVEVKIDIPLSQLRWNAALNGGAGAYETVTPAPSIDPASVTASTVTLLKVDGGAVTPVAYEAVTSTPGKLTLRKPLAAGTTSGPRRWAGGRYVVALRGGPSGVKTTDGMVVNADQAIALAIQNLDLSIKENQPPGFPPELAGQVNALAFTLWNKLTWQASASGAWTPGPDAGVTAAFPAVDSVFPYRETAVLATFAIDRSAHVALDSAAGQVPFPSDFLLEQNPANCPTGVAPCVVNNPAFGPAAQGLRTLDGFTTTGLLTATLTGPVTAASVTWGNVHLFELPSGGLPVRVKDLSLSSGALPTAGGANYVTQPPGTSAGGFTTTMVLAPAVPADLTGLGLGKFYLPPLKEKTRYAVVVTKRVTNADGSAMTRSAAGNIILGTTAPLYGPSPADPDCATDPAGAACTKIPYVSGLDLATAQGLQALRDGLAPLLANLSTFTGGASSKDDVAMVYTISTQSVTGTSLGLASAPFSVEAGAGAAIFAGTGIAPAPTPPGVPTGGIQGFYSLTFNTADLIDKATGALRPTLQSDLASPTVFPTLVKPLHALVAVPDPAAVPLCPGAYGLPAGTRCAKLVVVGHGLNGDKTTTYALASALASQGFIVAGIDFPLHGERNWCGADADCTTDGTANGFCDKTAQYTTAGSIDDFSSSAGQGDANRPGICANGSVPRPAGSRYLIGSNFFRTRDTFRQTAFDMTALGLAMARPPTVPQPAGNPLSAVLTPLGMVVDPATILYEGISWGAFNGASIMATNPRFSRGVLSVGGGTIVDVFSTSPSFQPGLDALMATLIPGYSRAAVTPGDPAFNPAVYAQYNQLLQVAKWILDPADPINYAQRIRTSPLPNLLANPSGTVAQVPKEVFTQVAQGDTVVPNPTNFLLDVLIDGVNTLYTDDDPAGGPAPHGMLATSAQVQIDAALYLVDPAAISLPATKAVAFP